MFLKRTADNVFIFERSFSKFFERAHNIFIESEGEDFLETKQFTSAIYTCKKNLNGMFCG